MRFILAGAPGLGKDDIAESLSNRFQIDLEGDPNLDPYKVGIDADYRVEMKLAAARTLLGEPVGDSIAAHSLIDSTAYTAFKLVRFKENEAPLADLERIVLMTTLVGSLLRDSFWYDHVYLISADFDEEDQYEQFQLQTLMLMLMDEYGINYSVIPAGDQAEEMIATSIEQYLNG